MKKKPSSKKDHKVHEDGYERLAELNQAIRSFGDNFKIVATYYHNSGIKCDLMLLHSSLIDSVVINPSNHLHEMINSSFKEFDVHWTAGGSSFVVTEK